MCSHQGLPKTGFQNSAQLRTAGPGWGQVLVKNVGGRGRANICLLGWRGGKAQPDCPEALSHMSPAPLPTHLESVREQEWLMGVLPHGRRHQMPEMGPKWSCCLRWGLFSWLLGLQPGPCLPHRDGGEQPTNTVPLSPGNTGALSGSF